MAKFKKKFTGWSNKGRPFTPKEYGHSYLKQNSNDSYSKYLNEWGRQYKNKKTRKYLLK